MFEDAGAVFLDRGGEPLERRQPAAPGPTDPAVQQRRGLRDVAAVREHLAQRLLEPPGPRGLQVRTLQPVHLVDLLARPVHRVLERAPANVFQAVHLLDLGAPHLIQRLVGQRHHVEGVEADRGIRAVFARARLCRPRPSPD